MAILSELEHDSLTEITNMAVGRAAGVLNEMIGYEVALSVPRVVILDQSTMEGEVQTLDGQSLTYIQQGFDGPLSGFANIAFPEKNSLELVGLLLGEELAPDEIVELEQEALQEMGNVILNAFLGTFGNELGVNISSEIPRFIKNMEAGGMTGALEGGAASIIFIHVDFVVKDRNINGYLVLAVSIATLEKLAGLLKGYVEKLL